MSGQRQWLRWAGLTALAVSGCLSSGCSSPNAANILLRKENQTLSGRVQTLQIENNGLGAQVKANETGPTLERLPQSRLDLLFTAHGLDIGRLSGGYSEDPTRPDQLLKVYAVPTDEDGQPIKAAGSFKIELFDLAEKQTQLGMWGFSVEQARADWFGRAFLYTYEFDCPWQTKPVHAKLQLRVTFTDELTGRVFTADRDVVVNPPG